MHKMCSDERLFLQWWIRGYGVERWKKLKNRPICSRWLKRRSSEILRDEMKICHAILENFHRKSEKSRKNTTERKKVIRIFEGWNENFQEILGLKSHEGNISVEMCSYEFLWKHALLQDIYPFIYMYLCLKTILLVSDSIDLGRQRLCIFTNVQLRLQATIA